MSLMFYSEWSKNTHRSTMSCKSIALRNNELYYWFPLMIFEAWYKQIMSKWNGFGRCVSHSDCFILCILAHLISLRSFIVVVFYQKYVIYSFMCNIRIFQFVVNFIRMEYCIMQDAYDYRFHWYPFNVSPFCSDFAELDKINANKTMSSQLDHTYLDLRRWNKFEIQLD